MRIAPIRIKDIVTPSGLMRTRVFEPIGNKPRPVVLLFSEIYQVTSPIARTAAFLAGHGYCVAVPDVYHEYTQPGEVFEYDKPGTDRGNQLKVTKPLSQYDSDANCLIDAMLSEEQCSGTVGVMGICLGGHLAFRAAMNPRVLCGVCLYATDIHGSTLGLGKRDNSMSRMSEIRGEMTMIWGRQDPHIPADGRRKIYDALTDANVLFSWHEFNAEHAFLRDEGHRYDPELVTVVHQLTLSSFERNLKQ